LVEPLAEHRCVNPDDIVRRRVVIGGTAENFPPDFLLVNLIHAVIEDPVR